MKVNEYQKLAARTINKDLNNNELEKYSLFGMVGKIGEIHSMYQKLYQGHRLNDNLLRKEIGDLLWLISEFCTACEWELEDIMQLNIDKLKSRYPGVFDSDKSLHRDKWDI